MTDPNDLAARMYPGAAAAAKPLEAPQPAPQPLAPDESARASELESDSEPESLAERLYPHGGQPPADGNYLPVIAQPFDDLEREVLESGDLDNLRLVNEGRALVNEAMQELGVGAPGAKELTQVFSHYRAKPISDEVLPARNESVLADLRTEWGKSFDSNLRHAKTAYEAACKRVPWLKAEIEQGAGSDAKVIRHFAAIGRRMARGGKR